MRVCVVFAQVIPDCGFDFTFIRIVRGIMNTYSWKIITQLTVISEVAIERYMRSNFK